MGLLACRGRAMQMAHKETKDKKITTVLAVHSLRGGLGCSSLVVNLGLAFHKLWGKQTLLVDGVFNSGSGSSHAECQTQGHLGESCGY